MSVNPQPVQNADAVRATRRERTAWFVLAILLLFSIAAPLNQFFESSAWYATLTSRAARQCHVHDHDLFVPRW